MISGSESAKMRVGPGLFLGPLLAYNGRDVGELAVLLDDVIPSGLARACQA